MVGSCRRRPLPRRPVRTIDDETAVFRAKSRSGRIRSSSSRGALFVLIPLGSLANPIDVLQRLSSMRRDLATASPGATTGARASLLEPS